MKARLLNPNEVIQPGDQYAVDKDRWFACTDSIGHTVAEQRIRGGCRSFIVRRLPVARMLDSWQIIGPGDEWTCRDEPQEKHWRPCKRSVGYMLRDFKRLVPGIQIRRAPDAKEPHELTWLNIDSYSIQVGVTFMRMNRAWDCEHRRVTRIIENSPISDSRIWFTQDDCLGTFYASAAEFIAWFNERRPHQRFYGSAPPAPTAPAVLVREERDGWRDLSPTETIQLGDQYWGMAGWTDCLGSVGEPATFLSRVIRDRRIAPLPGSGWRVLGPEELVEKGDEYWSGYESDWESCTEPGCRAGEYLPKSVRRPATVREVLNSNAASAATMAGKGVDMASGRDESVRTWKHTPDNSKPKFFRGPGGALLCDRAVEGLTDELRDDDTASYYGGKFIVGESISESGAKKIAEAFGEFASKDKRIKATFSTTDPKPYQPVYRTLVSDEIIQKGDEMRWKGEEWNELHHSIGLKIHQNDLEFGYEFRRSLPPGIPVKPEPCYRALLPGEIVEEGDQIKALASRSKKWNPCRFSIGNSVKEADKGAFEFRRPVASYRFLGLNDEILPGDEFQTSGGAWQTVTSRRLMTPTFYTTFKFRRLIK